MARQSRTTSPYTFCVFTGEASTLHACACGVIDFEQPIIARSIYRARFGNLVATAGVGCFDWGAEIASIDDLGGRIGVQRCTREASKNQQSFIPSPSPRPPQERATWAVTQGFQGCCHPHQEIFLGILGGYAHVGASASSTCPFAKSSPREECRRGKIAFGVRPFPLFRKRTTPLERTLISNISSFFPSC